MMNEMNIVLFHETSPCKLNTIFASSHKYKMSIIKLENFEYKIKKETMCEKIYIFTLNSIQKMVPMQYLRDPNQTLTAPLRSQIITKDPFASHELSINSNVEAMTKHALKLYVEVDAYFTAERG